MILRRCRGMSKFLSLHKETKMENNCILRKLQTSRYSLPVTSALKWSTSKESNLAVTTECKTWRSTQVMISKLTSNTKLQRKHSWYSINLTKCHQTQMNILWGFKYPIRYHILSLAKWISFISTQSRKRLCQLSSMLIAPPKAQLRFHMKKKLRKLLNHKSQHEKIHQSLVRKLKRNRSQSQLRGVPTSRCLSLFSSS